MKRWTLLHESIGMILAFCFLVGCGTSGSGTTFTPTPTVLAPTPTSTPMPTPTPTPTPTPIPPTPTPVPTPTQQTGPVGPQVAGQWTATANGLGTFTFTVSSNRATITEVVFHIPDITCGPVNAEIENADIHSSWPVRNGQFTLDAVPNPLLDAIISGSFDQTGRHASGTWKFVAFGTSCPGTWTANSAG